MKLDIHPKYVVSQVSCACGHTFATRSTKPIIKLEICSACHPFFTGRQKFIDTAGRLERFRKRFAKTDGRMVVRKPQAEMKKVVASVAPRRKVLRTTPTTKKAAKPDKKKG